MLAECELAVNLVRCSVLMLLYEKPLHGYAILEGLNARLERAVSPAIVYPFLAQMLGAGYLTSTSATIGKRPKIVYSLTPRGKSFSKRVFRRLFEIAATAVKANLLYCAHCGAKLYDAAHSETINGRRMAFCCVYCARAYRDASQALQTRMEFAQRGTFTSSPKSTLVQAGHGPRGR